MPAIGFTQTAQAPPPGIGGAGGVLIAIEPAPGIKPAAWGTAGTPTFLQAQNNTLDAVADVEEAELQTGNLNTVAVIQPTYEKQTGDLGGTFLPNSMGELMFAGTGIDAQASDFATTATTDTVDGGAVRTLTWAAASSNQRVLTLAGSGSLSNVYTVGGILTITIGTSTVYRRILATTLSGGFTQTITVMDHTLLTTGAMATASAISQPATAAITDAVASTNRTINVVSNGQTSVLTIAGNTGLANTYIKGAGLAITSTVGSVSISEYRQIISTTLSGGKTQTITVWALDTIPDGLLSSGGSISQTVQHHMRETIVGDNFSATCSQLGTGGVNLVLGQVPPLTLNGSVVTISGGATGHTAETGTVTSAPGALSIASIATNVLTLAAAAPATLYAGQYVVVSGGAHANETGVVAVVSGTSVTVNVTGGGNFLYADHTTLGYTLWTITMGGVNPTYTDHTLISWQIPLYYLPTVWIENNVGGVFSDNYANTEVTKLEFSGDKGLMMMTASVFGQKLKVQSIPTAISPSSASWYDPNAPMAGPSMAVIAYSDALATGNPSFGPHGFVKTWSITYETALGEEALLDRGQVYKGYPVKRTVSGKFDYVDTTRTNLEWSKFIATMTQSTQPFMVSAYVNQGGSNPTMICISLAGVKYRVAKRINQNGQPIGVSVEFTSKEIVSASTTCDIYVMNQQNQPYQIPAS